MSKKSGSKTPSVRSKAPTKPIVTEKGHAVKTAEPKPVNSSTFTCKECGKVTERTRFAPHALYCRECSGHKHTAIVPNGTKICRTCKTEFKPDGHDAWQVQRCPKCRADRLARIHARKEANKSDEAKIPVAHTLSQPDRLEA
jgi:hypothetical protein